MSARRLERIVVQALRERPYTPANLKTIIQLVRDDLVRKAKQAARVAPDESAGAIRALEGEIANTKEALAPGNPGPAGVCR